MKIFNSLILKILVVEAGQTLVELVIAIGLSAIFIPALLTGMVAARNGRAQDNQRTQAVAIARETQEAVRSIRNASWTTFVSYPLGQALHPVLSGSTWTLASGPELLNGFGFTRQVVINDVYRDGSGNISSSGTLDPSIKQVVVTVSWNSPFAVSVTTTTYLARFTNKFYQQTTTTDFNSGTNTGTIVLSTPNSSLANDGQIQLGAGGTGNWCNPNQTPIVKFDLTGQSVPTAISATYGHAYTTSGYNASGYSLNSVNISDPPTPQIPIVTAGSSFDNSRKTYGIYADSSYVYMTTNHPGDTMDIVQVSSNPYTLSGSYSDSGGELGNSIAVSGNTAYVVAGSVLYSVNVTNKSAPIEISKLNLIGTGNKIVINGNYAYIATSFVSTNNPKGQLEIVDITSPSSMKYIAAVNTGSGLNGVDVFINPTASYAYLVTNYSSNSIPDFYIIDISSKTSPVLHGNYNTAGMNPTGVITVSGNHAIIVGTGGLPYQVVSIANIDNPASCTPQGFSLNGVTSINAIATVSESDGDNYSYILTNDASNEFQIIEGGPGGSVAASGVYESATFDALSDVMFNNFSVNMSTPANTSLQYKVAIKHAVSGSCSSVSFADTDFVGSNGTSSTYFATSSALPIQINGTGYVNPGQCLKYRAYLSTNDSLASPEMYDATFNYSP